VQAKVCTLVSFQRWTYDDSASWVLLQERFFALSVHPRRSVPGRAKLGMLLSVNGMIADLLELRKQDEQSAACLEILQAYGSRSKGRHT